MSIYTLPGIPCHVDFDVGSGAGVVPTTVFSQCEIAGTDADGVLLRGDTNFLRIENGGNVLHVSFDGGTNHIVVAANAVLQLEVCVRKIHLKSISSASTVNIFAVLRQMR